MGLFDIYKRMTILHDRMVPNRRYYYRIPSDNGEFHGLTGNINQKKFKAFWMDEYKNIKFDKIALMTLNEIWRNIIWQERH